MTNVESSLSVDWTQSNVNIENHVPHKSTILKYRETIDRMRNDCLKNPLVPTTITDSQIIEFLNCCDYIYENAMKMIQNHYRMKNELPAVFTNRDISLEAVKNAWEILNIAFFPKPTVEGYVVSYIGLRDENPSVFDLPNVMKIYSMAKESYVRYHGLKRGFIFIVDCEKMSIRHFPFSNLMFFKKCLDYLQSVEITNSKKTIMYKCSRIANRFYNTTKPFYSKNLLEKLFFVPDLPELHKSICPMYLPADLGGLIPNNIEYFRNVMKETIQMAHSYFKEEEMMRRGSESQPVRE